MNTDKLVIFAVNDIVISENHIGINFDVIDEFSLLISNLTNNNYKVVLVSAGAILMGIKKTNLSYYPKDVLNQQVLASLGQVGLIKTYQKYFLDYGQKAAQVLLTRSIIHSHNRIRNAQNTIKTLLNMNIIPIINENDIISSEDIESRDNYPLAAIVANFLKADYLIVRSNSQSPFLILNKHNNVKFNANNHEDIFNHLEDSSMAPSSHTKSSIYPMSLS